MNQIRVCHMTSVHNSDDVRIFQKECSSLASAGYATYLVAKGGSREENGVHVIGIGPVPNGRIRRILSFSKAIYKRALSLDCEIYHFHDPELLPYGLKLKRKGKTVIFDSHEHTAGALLEKEYLPHWIRSFVYKCFTQYQKYVCSRLDAVISVSPHIVDYFKRINPNTVQVANYPIFKETELPSFLNKRIIFAGGIDPQWNHHVLLDALEIVGDGEYDLCGPASESYINMLKQKRAWDRVSFHGKVPHSQVAGLMQQSYLGVALLSPGFNVDWKNGSIGNTKIFEVMMAGLPLVCTDFVLWRKIIDKYECGVCVNPGNKEEIAKVIVDLFSDTEKSRAMGANGQRAVREEFNWSTDEAVLLNLYKSLLGSMGNKE